MTGEEMPCVAIFARWMVPLCKVEAIEESQLGLALPWPVLALFTLALLALCSVTQCVPLTRPGGSCYCAGPALLRLHNTTGMREMPDLIVKHTRM